MLTGPLRKWYESTFPAKVEFEVKEAGTFAKAPLSGAKAVWFPELIADSIVERVVLSRAAIKSAAAVRPLSLSAVRRPVMYDDWASADVASAAIRENLDNMAVVVGAIVKAEKRRGGLLGRRSGLEK